jgi:multiple sugar transport system substrate-binding protein
MVIVLLTLALTAGCPAGSRNVKLTPTTGSTPDQSTGGEVVPDNGGSTRSDLRLIVIDDPGLSEVIEREWPANTGSEVKARLMSTDKFLASIEPAATATLEADVIIFPSDMLGTLAERKLIRKFPREFLEADTFARTEIFDLVRLHDMKWGDDTYALSLGSPQFIYYYRTDVIPAPDAFPATWEAYDRFLSGYHAGEEDDREAKAPEAAQASAPRYACVEPLGPGWAGKVLLARAAGAIYDRGRFASPFDIRTAEPLLTQPPFVRALTQLVAAYRAGPPEARDFSPHDAARFFWSGQAAVALSWPSGARGETEPTGPMAMNFGALPGSAERYDFNRSVWVPLDEAAPQRVVLIGAAGRMIAVTRGAGNLRAAEGLAAWLAGPEQSSQLASRSEATTMFRFSQASQVGRWVESAVPPEAARSYAQLCQGLQVGGPFSISPRVPGSQRYLRALDQAVHAALDGAEPESALAKAARDWQQITENLGATQQKAALRRSWGS